jgi:hypothetical protein
MGIVRIEGWPMHIILPATDADPAAVRRVMEASKRQRAEWKREKQAERQCVDAIVAESDRISRLKRARPPAASAGRQPSLNVFAIYRQRSRRALERAGTRAGEGD